MPPRRRRPAKKVGQPHRHHQQQGKQEKQGKQDGTQADGSTSAPDRTPTPSAVATKSSSSPSSSSALQASSFEDDLDWCIQQLQSGFKPKGRLEAANVLKYLRSAKHNVIQKRAMMQKAFGDYRQLMKNEITVKHPAARNISIKNVTTHRSAPGEGFFRYSFFPCLLLSFSLLDKLLNQLFFFGCFVLFWI
eukprot:m.104907 g.104907  ORF g.104907 m.104907 type:complete len:191 (+) comp15095_c3_seq3:159-731(+)